MKYPKIRHAKILASKVAKIVTFKEFEKNKLAISLTP